MAAAVRRGFVTAGTWCVDYNKLIDAWPGEDAVTEILEVETRGGGSACNCGIDLRLLDPAMPVETIGLVGDDEAGRLLLAEADAHGIDRRRLALTSAAPTQFTDAYRSRRSGLRTHVYYPGTAALLTPEHLDGLEGTTGRILHLGLPGVHRRMDLPWQGEASGWVAVLKRARAAGLLTNLELASIEPRRIAELTRPCLPHLDLLVVNDVEIGAIAGEPTSAAGATDVTACVRAVRHVMEQGAMRVVAAHFPGGAVALERGGKPVLHASVRVPEAEIAGPNGAGDAFAAGFLYAHHEGWGLSDALALAHATSAASLRSMTTTGSVEAWRACLDLAARWGWRNPIG